MATKDHALQLLSQGIIPAQVAANLGVTESYISQLMADEDFAAQLQEVKTQQTAEDTQYDKRLDRAEEGFLERIESRIPFANLQQSMQGFKLLNQAKRRRDHAVSAGTQIGTLVNITLPVAIIPKYVLNQQSEIVEVEGQTMVSATPKGLEKIIADRKGPAAEGLQKQLESSQNVRAAKTLENVTKPIRRLTRSVPDSMVVDLL